jgi:hypothetical protein
VRLTAAPPLPQQLVPATFHCYSFREEPKAEQAYLVGTRARDVIVDAGRVFSIRSAQSTIGAVQFGHFRPGYRASDPKVAQDVRNTIGHFEQLTTTGGVQLYEAHDAGQRLYLWFPAHTEAMAVLATLDTVTEDTAAALAKAAIAYELGLPAPPLPSAGRAPVIAPSPAPTPSLPPDVANLLPTASPTPGARR